MALTTFGVGFGNFFGGSLIKITKSSVPYVSLVKIAKHYKTPVFGFYKSLGSFGESFLSHGFMIYLAIIIALLVSFFLQKTKTGLKLRAVGESPATADAAGINVAKYKYFATCIGGMIAGMGGLYYVLDYTNGIWSNDGFGDRGWLAIALVIFAVWNPNIGIIGSYLFGALLVLYNRISVSMQLIPIIQMLPYVVTVIVLILVSIRKKRETQPPASLGLSYFREDR